MSPDRSEVHLPTWLALSISATFLLGLVCLIRILRSAVRLMRNSLSSRDAELPHVAIVKYVRDDGTVWTELHVFVGR